MANNKVNSGLLEFSEDQKVFVALDAETSEVKKAVTIDEDGVETDIQGVQPAGKKEITSTAEVNVASYATAQVVDEDLVAGNIKKDVDILGVVGSYEGGASDFSTAQVTLISSVEDQNTKSFAYVGEGFGGEDEILTEAYFGTSEEPIITQAVLYNGAVKMSGFNPSVADATHLNIIGDATAEFGVLGLQYINITGNCTITIS